jgi:dihydrodipicolinate synthase/N-acetylneuraminate lyase
MIAKSVKFLREQGIHGYIAMGGMGQCHNVTDKEFNKVVDVLVDATEGSQICVVGNMVESTQECIRRAKYSEDAGVDGIMVHIPKGAPMTLDAAWEHFRMVNDAIDDLQILAYDFPPYRGPRLSPEFWANKLLTLDRITALKMAYRDSIYRTRLLRRIAHKINVLGDIWNESALGSNSTLAIFDSWWAPKTMLEYFKGCMDQPDISKRSDRLRKMHRAYMSWRLPQPGTPLTYPMAPPGTGLAWECAALNAMVNFTTEWTGITAGPVRKPYPTYPPERLKAFNANAQRYIKAMSAFGDTHVGIQPTAEMLERAVARV